MSGEIRHKEFRFPVEIGWDGGRRATAYVAAAALAEREGMTLQHLDVRAEGIVGRRPDGRFGFVRIEQTVVVDVDPGDEMAAAALVANADETCLVTVSLDLPVETRSRFAPAHLRPS